MRQIANAAERRGLLVCATTHLLGIARMDWPDVHPIRMGVLVVTRIWPIAFVRELHVAAR
jgi:hypothetical protein